MCEALEKALVTSNQLFLLNLSIRAIGFTFTLSSKIVILRGVSFGTCSTVCSFKFSSGNHKKSQKITKIRVFSVIFRKESQKARPQVRKKCALRNLIRRGYRLQTD